MEGPPASRSRIRLDALRREDGTQRRPVPASDAPTSPLKSPAASSSGLPSPSRLAQFKADLASRKRIAERDMPFSHAVDGAEAEARGNRFADQLQLRKGRTLEERQDTEEDAHHATRDEAERISEHEVESEPELAEETQLLDPHPELKWLSDIERMLLEEKLHASIDVVVDWFPQPKGKGADTFSDQDGVEDSQPLLTDAEEGLYTPAALDVAAWNREKAFKRLLREDPKKQIWFDSDGKVIRELTGLGRSFVRPVNVSGHTSRLVRTRVVSGIASQRANFSRARRYRLDVDVGRFVFQDHPLFSKEDYLAAQLTVTFEAYMRKCESRLLEFYEERFHALLDQIENLRRQGVHHVSTPDDGQPLNPKSLKSLTIQLQEVRNLRDQERYEIHNVASELYKLWVQLKQHRLDQGYSSTTVKLVVKNRLIDVLRDQEDREREIEQEIEELRDQSTDGYFNVESVRRDILSRMDRIPDRPRYTFQLTHGVVSVQQNDKSPLPLREVQRRLSIQRCRVFIRVYINNRYVVRTKKQFIQWPGFCLDFQDKFHVDLFHRPSHIKLQIAMGSIVSSKVADVLVDVPGSEHAAVTSTGALNRQLNFAATAPMHLLTFNDQLIHDGSGSGVSSFHPGPRHICGSFFTRLEWVDQDGSAPVAEKRLVVGKDNVIQPIQQDKLLPQLSGTKDTKLRELLKDFLFDPNDPRNKQLLELLKSSKISMIRDLAYRVTKLERDALLPLADVKSIRIEKLKERTKKLQEDWKPIPNLESELNQVKQIPEMPSDFEDSSSDDEITANGDTVKRKKTSQFIKQVRSRQKAMRAGQRRHYTVGSVVKEFQLQQQESTWDLTWLTKWFEPQRKLRPPRKQRKATVGEVKNSRIIIQIVKAYNVPVRKSALSSGDLALQKPQARLGPSIGTRLGSIFGSGGIFGGSTRRLDTAPVSTVGQYPGPLTGSRFDPTGTQTDLELGQPEPQVDYSRATKVNAYVEIRYVNGDGKLVHVRTQTIDSANPEWNQILEIPFIPPARDWSPENLKNTTSQIYFLLFDELRVGSAGDDREQDTTTFRRERRFLGSFSIPFTTLYFNPPRMEGQFRLNRPLTLLGYQPQTLQANPLITSDPYARMHMDYGQLQQMQNLPPVQRSYDTSGNFHNAPTYLNVVMTLDPLLSLPIEPKIQVFPGFEEKKLLLFGTRFVSSVKSTSSVAKRYVAVFGTNISGQSVFICRYICPLAPPADIIQRNDPHALEKAVRFVSLIPFVEDWQAFADLGDLWCTSQEFLDLRAGDFEEHAILLCNYFLWLDGLDSKYKSYVVLGTGVPEGNTCYVLRKHIDTGDAELWNASTGEVFTYRTGISPESRSIWGNLFGGTNRPKSDGKCPLINVGCVFNAENVWVNIQPSGEPASMTFDLNNKKRWKPFFATRMERDTLFPTGVIEPLLPTDTLQYAETPRTYAQDLQLKIEKELMKRFERKRSSSSAGRRSLLTRWNGAVREKLKDMLDRFEEYKQTSRIGAIDASMVSERGMSDADLERIKEEYMSKLTVGHDVFGFSVNMTYTEVDLLWEALLNTDVHTVADNDAEFAISVRVFSYPCFVCSVWVYVAALVPQQVRHKLQT
eukprot:GILJ01008844.1.p1 GENE.GILJ01008844.1~~GILJ01008844.1.p1  ORF type:complete len:1598 (-),score=270.09 GILJ01008844.1:58-4851(-)